LPALRRVSRGRTLTEVETVRHTHRHRLVKCLSRFHLLGFTTLQTQVPCVSIGRRGRPCLCFGSQTVVHCQRASHLEECRSSTHAACPSHRSPDGPFQATRSPVKGRTPPYPMAVPGVCLFLNCTSRVELSPYWPAVPRRDKYEACCGYFVHLFIETALGKRIDRRQTGSKS
jgi:hypothetical protein